MDINAEFKGIIAKISKEYPDVTWQEIIPYGKKYICIGINGKYAEIHSIDEKGDISGAISPLSIYKQFPEIDDCREDAYFFKEQKDDHLEHHGIKGQKWGVKHGPPYPLDSADHKAVVSRSSKGLSDDDKATLIAAGAMAAIAVGKAVVDKIKRSDAFNTPAKKIEKAEKMIPKIQETAKMLKDLGVTSEERFNEEHFGGYSKVDPDATFKNSKKLISEDDDASKINPDYGKQGTTNNCALCTVAYDLRRRGYDVKAKKAETGLNMAQLLDAYKDPKTYMFNSEKNGNGFKNWDEAESTIASLFPEGSRGELAMGFANGAAHSVVFEVKNGGVLIRDTQSNEKYNLKDISKGYELGGFMAPNSRDVNVTRLDNLEPNLDYLKKCVTDV